MDPSDYIGWTDSGGDHHVFDLVGTNQRRPAGPVLVGETVEAVLDEPSPPLKARRDRLDVAIAEMAAESKFTPLVHRLGCLRGVSTLTGFALAVEIGDWVRFTGNTIGSFVGLLPSEHFSGSSRVQGSITKTGNTHVRRLLVEAAWHHRPEYRIARTMRDRWELAPAAARARGDEGNRRLHHRWVKFIGRRKKSTVANVANVANVGIARELAGWCWSLAMLENYSTR